MSRWLARYRTEGDAAFEPRSRRPLGLTDQRPATTSRRLIVNLRRELTAEGLDAGPETIGWHLQHHHHITVSISDDPPPPDRRRAGHPRTRRSEPKSSYIRFQADQPNECWQSDFTHWRLADGTDIEILTWLDDHSRYALSVTAHQPVTGRVVVDTFRRHRR